MVFSEALYADESVAESGSLFDRDTQDVNRVKSGLKNSGDDRNQTSKEFPARKLQK